MASTGQDSKLFVRNKLADLRAELQGDKKDKDFKKRKVVLKRVVASMTMGQDMSPLYPEVIACLSIEMLDIKKMVYLYLINYARVRPEMVKHAMPGFLAVSRPWLVGRSRVGRKPGGLTCAVLFDYAQDAGDRNALIRALAIRTMSYLAVPEVLKALVDPLHACLRDRDPYVRKTAAICVAKLYMHDRRLVDKEGFVNQVKDLLGDPNPTVVANAVAALTEISERSESIHLRLNTTVASRLVSAMGECSEWGQTYILEALMYYVPEEHADAELLAERIAIRLQHSNSAVVLTTVKVILYLMNYMGSREVVDNMCRKLSPPLGEPSRSIEAGWGNLSSHHLFRGHTVTLLSSGYEVQYVALRNIHLIIQRRPSVLKNDVRVFFCKYNDPIYVKLAKLEIIYRLANEKNVEQVLAELKEYASEVDVEFVRKAVRSIGRLAIKIASAADLCITALLALVKTKVNYVVQEAIVVIKDIFRRYPNQYEGIIGTLCENLDALDTPDAKAAMIWILGEYADRIENSDELLDDFLFSFADEPVEVQLALLTATVKLFIKRPTAGQELVPKVLKWATEDVDNPDLRDRGFIYWRLLSTNPGVAGEIVLADKPEISTESEAMDRGVLDRLLLHTGTLASLYMKEPQTFVRGARAKSLHDSPALDPLAKQSQLDSIPVVPAPTTTATNNGSGSRPVPAPPTTGSAPPALPPRLTRKESVVDDLSTHRGEGLLDDDDSEDEDVALNPAAANGGAASAQTTTVSKTNENNGSNALPSPLPIDDDLDPYASLARMSFEQSAQGGMSAFSQYGYEADQPRGAGVHDQDLL
ncbi:BQ5605_C016g08077 [Microbotryum silenes-dioicae]|uniref:AP complex subunit beta n=1 Tax=Microbotryum silenes-dioicae TaxID=796604 RepID=A0A2X0MH00_9BASI|nr:BQ5605_C016g08077 [Microbotryum silenes-dioicae]